MGTCHTERQPVEADQNRLKWSNKSMNNNSENLWNKGMKKTQQQLANKLSEDDCKHARP